MPCNFIGYPQTPGATNFQISQLKKTLSSEILFFRNTSSLYMKTHIKNISHLNQSLYLKINMFITYSLITLNLTLQHNLELLLKHTHTHLLPIQIQTYLLLSQPQRMPLHLNKDHQTFNLAGHICQPCAKNIVTMASQHVLPQFYYF